MILVLVTINHFCLVNQPLHNKDRKSTRLNSSHLVISYAVFCLSRLLPRSTVFPYTTLFRSALAITLGIAGALLLLFILLKWSLPTVPPVPTQEFLEVNLGTDDFGSGDDQPLLPGEPAPAQQTSYTPPQPVKAVAEDVKDVETDDREENEAPAIRKPVVAKPNA